jgi:hypothetical protein
MTDKFAGWVNDGATSRLHNCSEELDKTKLQAANLLLVSTRSPKLPERGTPSRPKGKEQALDDATRLQTRPTMDSNLLGQARGLRVAEHLPGAPRCVNV